MSSAVYEIGWFEAGQCLVHDTRFGTKAGRQGPGWAGLGRAAHRWQCIYLPQHCLSARGPRCTVERARGRNTLCALLGSLWIKFQLLGLSKVVINSAVPGVPFPSPPHLRHQILFNFTGVFRKFKKYRGMSLSRDWRLITKFAFAKFTLNSYFTIVSILIPLRILH